MSQAGLSRQQVSVRGLLNLLAVYVIWSSTYLAIRIAVRDGSGFPPFMMSALRIGTAGLLLLGAAFVVRSRLRLTRQELTVLTISGLLLWIGGNGMVTWAETRAHSGYAALLVGSMPMWVAGMEALVDRRSPSPRLIGALLVGLIGVGILTVPVVAAGTSADLLSVGALLVAPITWGAGSLYQKQRGLHLGVLATAGYQNAIGGIGLLFVALIAREPVPDPTPEAWIAWGYLVVIGSLVAFTAFVQVLRLLPMSIGMTYAYVNPVGAVLLGWWLLGEPVTTYTLLGAALVLAGVAGVFREQLRLPAPPVATAAVEESA